MRQARLARLAKRVIRGAEIEAQDSLRLAPRGIETLNASENVVPNAVDQAVDSIQVGGFEAGDGASVRVIAHHSSILRASLISISTPDYSR